MSLNFNDPASVQALLDQIRSSSAWQELSVASVSNAAPSSTPISGQESTPDAIQDISLGPSVASLLSQLKSAPGTQDPSIASTAKTVDHPERARPSKIISPNIPSVAPTGPADDLRWLDLEESMPILLKLSRDSVVSDEMKKIKREQDILERRLWEERRSIHRKYEDKIKTSKTKANIMGGSISKHETEKLSDAHQKELSQFDRDRALPAWDSLVSQQQLKLQRLHVPTMHVTSSFEARELQHRVLQVLMSLIGPSFIDIK